MTTRIATCTCGQLSAKVTGDPIRISVCHCYACQQRSGSVFASQARFPRQAVEITGSGTEYVRVGDEGGRGRFTFCPICGVNVFYVNEAMPESIAIPIGTFSDSSFPAPGISVYEERMHSWVTMPVDMEHVF